MKVLHVIDSAGLYGAEAVLLNLMAEQVRLGLDPVLASIGTVAAGEKAVETEARLRGFRVEGFRMRPGPNLLGLWDMLRFARKERVNLIHTHGYKADILFGLLPRSLKRVPVIATLHGWTWMGKLDRMTVYQWLDRKALRFMHRVVLVNPAMKEHHRLKGEKWRIEVVPNGIPLDGRMQPQSVEHARVADFCSGGATIGAVGRLSPEKGFDLLVEAFSALVAEGRDLRLVIVGEGGEQTRLEQRVRELGLEDRVLMPGYLPGAQACLPFFRIFAISSHTEGLPMVLLEALLAGVPVVATRVGGIPDVLQQGKAGVLVAPEAARLAEGIRQVLDNETASATRATFGTRLVRSTYSARTMALSYHKIYDAVCSEA